MDSSPKDKMLDLSKLKAFADNNSNASQMINCISENKETMWEKVKMIIISLLFLFPQYFQKLSSSGPLQLLVKGDTFTNVSIIFTQLKNLESLINCHQYLILSPMTNFWTTPNSEHLQTTNQIF